MDSSLNVSGVVRVKVSMQLLDVEALPQLLHRLNGVGGVEEGECLVVESGLVESRIG